MKLFIAFTFSLLVHFAIASPQVPNKIKFAGMDLSINSSAKAMIQKDVDRIHKSQTYFNQMVAKANLFFPVIEDVFAKENFPDEIKYLIIQESAINPDAVSSSNAVGYWQFKQGTAIEVGLKVGGGIDERKNIVRASKGAATYIKKNNAKLDNYVYALISYNTGLGGVQKEVKPKYIGAKKMEINGNTHWYFLKFLAHYIAYKDYIHKTPHELMLVVDENQGGNSIKHIAKENGMTVDELDPYNRWISSHKSIPTDKSYSVIIPKPNNGQNSRVIAATSAPTSNSKFTKEEIDKQVDQNIATDVHENLKSYKTSYRFDMNRLPAVKAGDNDNVSTITRHAKRELDHKHFLKYNDMRKFQQIESGQVYYLKKKKRKARLASFHVVKEGETLWEIAQYYGIRLKSLKRKNHLKRKQNYVKTGLVLWLRDTRPAEIEEEYRDVKSIAKVETKTAPAPTTMDPDHEEEAVAVETSSSSTVSVVETTKVIDEGFMIHKVAKSESLFSISRLYNVGVGDIIEWNELEETSLNLGQELLIKKPTVEKESSAKKYTVQAGDTMYRVATKFNISVDQLKAWNNKTDNSLSVGEEVIVGE